MRMRRSKEEWAKLIQEQKNSEKSITGFCKEKGIHPNLFYRKTKTIKIEASSAFVKVPVAVQKDKSMTISYGKLSIRISSPITKDDIVLILTSMKEAGYAELS